MNSGSTSPGLHLGPLVELEDFVKALMSSILVAEGVAVVTAAAAAAEAAAAEAAVVDEVVAVEEKIDRTVEPLRSSFGPWAGPGCF